MILEYWTNKQTEMETQSGCHQIVETSLGDKFKAKNSAAVEHATDNDKLVGKTTVTQIYACGFYHALSRQLSSAVLHTHKCILQHLSTLRHG